MKKSRETSLPPKFNSHAVANCVSNEHDRQPMGGDADPIEASGFRLRLGALPILDENILAHPSPC